MLGLSQYIHYDRIIAQIVVGIIAIMFVYSWLFSRKKE